LLGSSTLFPEINEPGAYTLLVTNENNGCTATAEVLVLQQAGGVENVLLNFENPSCQGLPDGWIALFDTDGGISYFLNGVVTETPIWRDLSGGSYQILVEDAAGCQWDTMVNLTAPNSVLLWLADDMEVQLGDSVSFEAQINLPPAAIDTLIWSPEGLLDCDSCYAQHYTPQETILFTARVIDENGCEATEDILIRVIKDRLIYIPNAFSPNGDGRNDLLMIHGGSGVQQINTFQIYDRYGALVYRADNFQPNNPSYSWDGYHMGKAVNPAVFAFYAEVLFTDGRKQLYKGDITIVK
jgi:gliding motility-associated-like protein